jgi:hypothetical protein
MNDEGEICGLTKARNREVIEMLLEYGKRAEEGKKRGDLHEKAPLRY